jgi:hypothetical protein
MNIKWKALVEGFLKGRFSIMLLTFVALFLVVPVMPVNWGGKVSDGLTLLVLISCLRAISVSRIFLISMVSFTLALVLVDSIATLKGWHQGLFQTALLSLQLGYLILVFISIMHYVLDRSPVTADKVYGALSAYFLLGFSWSIGFTLFYHIEPASFNIPIGESKTWATYFSFTTLTTLGYGDITPETVGARAYAIMEAACGQIFLAVIVARLIALQITNQVRGES